MNSEPLFEVGSLMNIFSPITDRQSLFTIYYMPITKTAKRALRGSLRKKIVNRTLREKLEKAIRAAKKSKKPELIKIASSFADKAVKGKIIHKNKAAHIKSSLSKLLKQKIVKTPSKKKTSKKSSSK